MLRSHFRTAVLVSLVALLCAACAAPATPVPPSPTQAKLVQATEVPPTSAPVSASATPVPPADTAVPPTDTSVPPTASPAPPTETAVPPSETPAPTDTLAPTDTPQPTAVPTDTLVPTVALPANPDPVTGEQVWKDSVCMSCHGQDAEGAFGPKLTGTGLSFDQILARVRLGKGQMPAFAEDVISDLELQHIVSWLRSLAKPTPTPISPPSFPTQALTEMWYFVNEMRIRADFAKDLPVRQAQDDAGRLAIVKAYAGDGLAQTAQVLDRANRALNEVPHEHVKETIRRVIDETNQVANLFNQARAQSTYGAGWPFVAEAARICRIDTQPRATQAVRDAGLVGTVRVRVVDQAGRPISGAFVTALTAHTPLGVRTDSAGRTTLVNVAAVPALPVKAYAEGRVYHEINVNLSPGATTEGTIALPPLPRAGVAPAVANPAIEPSAGAGNATVLFAVTATDPQGRLDLAEDQIFALNPDLGEAYVLLHVGGNRYEARQRLPDLQTGLHTWHFFAVDHECHTSQIIPVRYRVQ